MLARSDDERASNKRPRLSRAGLTASAAAVGVEARRSATMSAMDVSGLVADAGDHRHGALRDHARQPLVVEGHEILERPAAAHHEHHLGPGAHDRAHALNDAGGRVRALDRHARDEHASQREPAGAVCAARRERPRPAAR